MRTSIPFTPKSCLGTQFRAMLGEVASPPAGGSISARTPPHLEADEVVRAVARGDQDALEALAASELRVALLEQL